MLLSRGKTQLIFKMFAWMLAPILFHDGNSEATISDEGPLCCDAVWHASWGNQDKHGLKLNRTQWQTKVMMPPKSNLLNHWVYWDYLQEYDWGCLHGAGWETAISIKAYPSLGKPTAAPEYKKPGDHYTTCKQRYRFRRVAGQVCWYVTPPGSWACLRAPVRANYCLSYESPSP